MTETAGDAHAIFAQNFSTDGLAFEVLKSDDVVEGDPLIENATLHQSDDGTLLIGVARMSGGATRYEQPADEIDYVKSGKLIITSEQGDEIVAEAGSVTYLKKGIVYTRNAVEPYEEVYVLFSEDSFEL
ncbi:DUF861 domain-containing protein [Mycobacterium sp. CBMA293]|uniref:cupin domain-containing protein n=1 Tax=unclassified Mycolicibacterium TaxID=2636767 RepID=UPI0012DCCAFE|nr:MULTISPECIES: cupin domain-containing protein [unclassified Mycolicibacterium]MUL49389.1 DUF861 domain-containing protein [Mycolicibacterium sp. CBMA 360]MUL62565.1 DUF861 domain-containing protein [Mycolicibacterium sp. CBMA 335]MUL69017.1 DUF861 domain-containing protein [Mycolicibacterium sp. CBMA 311]MUL96956.1 DUF861 domain-containing protein [Mycolicibacterium sp. CBMA 230]MUM04006.1 hypothetical protein [Mycolicibacterium sp. CBMA 213]